MSLVVIKMVDRTDEDMLALPLANRADVRDDDLIVGQTMFFAHFRARVPLFEFIDRIEMNPARYDAEVVVKIAILVVSPGGGAEEQRVRRAPQRFVDQLVQIELEL